MARPVTLFTGQWADLPLETLAEKAKSFGYDGLELACWGDHFDVTRALSEDGYVKSRWDILNKYGLQCYAISNHLAGQAVCDIIDERHKGILPPHVWGDGKPEGVNRRAAEEVANTARAAKALGVKVVPGFTGSSIWRYVYSFPAVSNEMINAGYKEFADRWNPILDVFDEVGVRFALEVHPTEIAFDIASAERALQALNHRAAFGFNYDPSHFGYQGVDYVGFIRKFRDRIYHVHMKDVGWSSTPTEAGVFGGTYYLRRCAPILGLPLAWAWQYPLRGDHPRAKRDWLPGAALRRVGRQRHGSRARRDRSSCVRKAQ